MTTQLIPSTPPIAPPIVATLDERYEHEETRALVALVTDAAQLIRGEGEAAFSKFRVAGSRWCHDETYVFVLDRTATCSSIPTPRSKARTSSA